MRFARRKWGYYITLLSGDSFKVKLLRFNGVTPLSMQRHSKRDELWLFLSGLDKGIFWHIPRKQWHTYKPKAWVLEIQYGDKCVEEDIERK